MPNGQQLVSGGLGRPGPALAASRDRAPRDRRPRARSPASPSAPTASARDRRRIRPSAIWNAGRRRAHQGDRRLDQPITALAFKGDGTQVALALANNVRPDL